jgi:hypothetical protein
LDSVGYTGSTGVHGDMSSTDVHGYRSSTVLRISTVLQWYRSSRGVRYGTGTSTGQHGSRISTASGIQEQYRGTGVQEYNLYRSSTGVQEYYRGIGVQKYYRCCTGVHGVNLMYKYTMGSRVVPGYRGSSVILW